MSRPDPLGPGRKLRVLVAQINTLVGDVAGNTERIVEILSDARSAGAHVAVFPELTVCGYPPEDLLLRPSFIAECEAAIDRIALQTAGLTAIVGFADRDGGDLHNAAAVLHDGRIADVYHKIYLPNYSVFDEERYFKAGRRAPVYDLGGIRFGVSICEDMWYPTGPAELQARAGAEILFNISASPFEWGKAFSRERMLATRAADNVAYVVYCNLVGGQDELVFDGNSVVLGPDGACVARGASLREDVFVVDLRLEEVFREQLLDPRDRKGRYVVEDLAETPMVALGEFDARPSGPATMRTPVVGKGSATVDTPMLGEGPPAKRTLIVGTGSATMPTPTVGAEGRLSPRGSGDVEPLTGLDEVYAALVLGTRDYVDKNGFRTVVIGLSGGIDSAMTATIAVDALGPERVVGVAMPARYSSPESLRDAAALAAMQGIELIELPVDSIFQSFLEGLRPILGEREPDVTEENLQSRIRGTALMALSNANGWLVLTTGNKSETSVGYSTLYGDTAGGFAPLKDVPKTIVYDLARHRNARDGHPVIPEHTITRAPSAELRPDQTDQDSLPPYDVLDAILARYVEREMGVDETTAEGFDGDVVRRVASLVDRSEYKRRQAPPGIKISGRAFGRDRRMPITRG